MRLLHFAWVGARGTAGGTAPLRRRGYAAGRGCGGDRSHLHGDPMRRAQNCRSRGPARGRSCRCELRPGRLEFTSTKRMDKNLKNPSSQHYISNWSCRCELRLVRLEFTSTRPALGRRPGTRGCRAPGPMGVPPGMPAAPRHRSRNDDDRLPGPTALELPGGLASALPERRLS